MDGTRPGPGPGVLDVAFATNYAGWPLGANAACAGAPGVTVQTCIVDWPWQPFAPAGAPIVPLQHTHYHFTPTSLSDTDVERIAKRVAELLKAAP